MAGIAREEQHSGLRAKRGQFVGQLASTEVGHHHVGDGEVNRRSVIFCDGQSLQPVSRFQHGVTTKAEKFGRSSTQSVLIFHQQQGLRATRRGINPEVRYFECGHPILHARQVDLEDGSHSAFAIGPDESMILFDDAIDRRQPKSGALAEGLGGVEGLENVRQMIRRNTGTGVAHG